MPSNAVDPSSIFQCQMCGACCQGYGGTYVTPSDINAISDYIGVDADAFVKRYCQISGHRPVLGQGPDGCCVFHRDGRCGIHPVKPRMCQNWPFIESVVVDPANWQMMAGSCPGMRTDVEPEVVRECVATVIRQRNRA